MTLVDRLDADGCPHNTPDNGCFVCSGCAEDLHDAAARIRALEAEVADHGRLLGAARMVLDRIAERRDGPAEAADMARRIVDITGHSVTDEPPHVVVERDALRRAAELALPLLKQAEQSGLPSCRDAARRALVNDDQHDAGCRVREAIRALDRALAGPRRVPFLDESAGMHGMEFSA